MSPHDLPSERESYLPREYRHDLQPATAGASKADAACFAAMILLWAVLIWFLLG